MNGRCFNYLSLLIFVRIDLVAFFRTVGVAFGLCSSGWESSVERYGQRCAHSGTCRLRIWPCGKSWRF